MITCNINVTRIDKAALFEGKNGKYLNLTLLDNKDGPDQYGNHGFIVQDIGQARRQAGEKGPIIGNFKRLTPKAAPAPAPAPKTTHELADDDIPF
jgi:hypothetical protein